MAAVRMSVQDLAASATLLSLEEQRQLNSRLVENIKHARVVASIAASANFKIGDIVWFNAGPRRGNKIIKIEEYGSNRTKVKGRECSREGVIHGLGMTWTVPMHMLRKI
jgi:hypothetical protein